MADWLSFGQLILNWLILSWLLFVWFIDVFGWFTSAGRRQESWSTSTSRFCSGQWSFRLHHPIYYKRLPGGKQQHNVHSRWLPASASHNSTGSRESTSCLCTYQRLIHWSEAELCCQNLVACALDWYCIYSACNHRNLVEMLWLFLNL